MLVSTPEIKKRVVIISQADKLNIEAQNALLKLLEEPREDILFILETHTLEPILPTIKSRCWVINFQPLEKTIIRNYLQQKFNNQINLEIINAILEKYNGENLSDLIEEIYLFINEDNDNEKLLFNGSEQKPNFIELFRFIYLSNFYQSLNYLDQFNILTDRNYASVFINELLKFSYLVLKTKLSEENKENDLIKLSKVIDENQFRKVIEYLANCQFYIESYVNLNLVFIKLFILIHNSFIKKI